MIWIYIIKKFQKKQQLNKHSYIEHSRALAVGICILGSLFYI